MLAKKNYEGTKNYFGFLFVWQICSAVENRKQQCVCVCARVCVSIILSEAYYLHHLRFY